MFGKVALDNKHYSKINDNNNFQSFFQALLVLFRYARVFVLSRLFSIHLNRLVGRVQVGDRGGVARDYALVHERGARVVRQTLRRLHTLEARREYHRNYEAATNLRLARRLPLLHQLLHALLVSRALCSLFCLLFLQITRKHKG